MFENSILHNYIITKYIIYIIKDSTNGTIPKGYTA